MQIGSYELYNAGKRIKELIQIDNPYNHDNDNACKSFYNFDAPERGFVRIPSQLSIGEATVAVLFIEDILAKHGPRGVVLVNSNLDDADVPEDKPIANTKEKGVQKAEKLWKAHLQDVANIHLNFCQDSLAKGGKPGPAYGFTAFALKELGISDPGSPATIMGNNSSDIEELKKTLAEQQKLIEKLMSKK